MENSKPKPSKYKALLTPEVYQAIGKNFNEVVTGEKWQIAQAVLDKLQSPIAPKARHEGEYFFKNWLQQNGGLEPRKFMFVDEKHQWVGLALLIAFSHEESNRETSSPDPPRQPSKSKSPNRFILTIAVFSGKAREIGVEEAHAEKLSVQSAYWWAGSAEDWEKIQSEINLSTILEVPVVVSSMAGQLVQVGQSPTGSNPTEKAQASGEGSPERLSQVDGTTTGTILDLPESDDDLLLFVYEVSGAKGVPSNRLDMSDSLQKATGCKELKRIGTFTIHEPGRLKEFGFHR